MSVSAVDGAALLAAGTLPLIYASSGLLTFELAELAYGDQTFRIDVTLHPAPYTIHPDLLTLHPAPHPPKPSTVNPSPYTLHPQPSTLNP